MTEKEREQLIELLPHHSVPAIAEQMGKAKRTIYRWCKTLPQEAWATRYKRNCPWTEWEKDYLRKHHISHTIATIAETLNRNESAIVAMVWELKLTPIRSAIQQQGYLTSKQFAYIFDGVGNHYNVQLWVKRGMIEGYLVGRRASWFAIPEREIYNVIQNHPDKFCIYQMPESKYKTFAQRYWKHKAIPDLSVKELARKAGVSDALIKKEIYRGKIKAGRKPGYGRVHFIDKEEAERYLDTRRGLLRGKRP